MITPTVAEGRARATVGFHYRARLLAALCLFSLVGIWYALLPAGGRRRQALTRHPDTPSRTAHILKEVKRRVLPA